MINLTTGPVDISQSVSLALSARPIPHRSARFKRLYHEVEKTLCEQLSVRKLAMLSGSGTLANEAMLWQIKIAGGKGIILSNGEFGDRLIAQASRIGLNFSQYSISWGQRFDLEKLEVEVKGHTIKWILFTHCETSTGVINPLEEICQRFEKYQFSFYVDCMSSIGTRELDLSKVEMATASSSKGLASIPGIAMVFSNVPFRKINQMPSYFDLVKFNEGNIPFTLSSNQLSALQSSISKQFDQNLWAKKEELSKLIYASFKTKELIPFSDENSMVYTFCPPNCNSMELGDQLLEKGIELSYESNYLVNRNWFQLSLFGQHTRTDIEQAISSINSVLQID